MIDLKLQAELRSRFNPDSSDLRTFQLRLLDLLLEFDAICKENGIEYWLSSGNVLGAVRHGGFIPWDDDVDIEMSRDNFRKLEKVFTENTKYALQSYKTDPFYPLITPKFRDKRGNVNEDNGCVEWQKYNGAFIDVFVIEKTYANVSHFLSWGVSIQRLIYRNRKYMGPIAKPLFRILNLGTHVSVSIARAVCKVLPGKEFRHCYGSGFHHSKRCITDIYPLGQLEFEGHLFPTPHDPDKYLTRMYGDYNNLPDLNQIHQHFSSLTHQ